MLKRENYINNLLFDNFPNRSAASSGREHGPQEGIALKLIHHRLNLQKRLWRKHLFLFSNVYM